MKLLMVDNYDSFTYNIVQYFGELGAQVEVFRNDEITVTDIQARLNAGQLDRLVISPGPCSPAEAGISVAAIQHFAGKLPILGVCLGHQAIGAAFGGTIVRAQQLMHGKTSVITTTQKGVFAGLPEKFTVNRYHSLAIERATCPEVLEVTAWTEDGEIMGVRHKTLPSKACSSTPRVSSPSTATPCCATSWNSARDHRAAAAAGVHRRGLAAQPHAGSGCAVHRVQRA